MTYALIQPYNLFKNGVQASEGSAAKGISTKPDSLSPISSNHVVQGELTTQLAPALTHMPWCLCACTYTHQHEWFECK